MQNHQENQEEEKNDVEVDESFRSDKLLRQPGVVVYGELTPDEYVNEDIKSPQKNEIESLERRLERMDTDYTSLEEMFYNSINNKAIEIEHLDPQELNEREAQIEFQELKRLEKQLKKVEKEKVSLLTSEHNSERNLLLTSGYKGFARERNRALTKLYGRLNSKIKSQILSNEGISKSSIRKINPYVKDKLKNQRLFEGIRDQKIGAKWLKTPQPVEVKVMMVRGLKDKIPKGNYVIRAGILDRMVENKIYYKFIEYGNKVKAHEEAEKEKKLEESKINKSTMSSKLFPTESKDEIKKADVDEELEELKKETEEMVIFKQSEEEQHDIEQGHHKPTHHVQFTDDDSDHDQEHQRQKHSKFNEMMKSYSNPKKKPQEQEQQPSDFDKLARQSLFKPEGGALSQIQKHQNVEKVWLDFGKQHTKLVEFEGEHDSEEMKFDGHKIYFIAPPGLYLMPSNILIFELIWMSSQTTKKDYITAWGSFPLVNGDFEINQGKFKLPLLNGEISFSTNKFKDIEKKYIRNIDEWVGNLYIEIKKFEIVDFQIYNQRIELKISVEEEKKEKKKDNKKKSNKVANLAEDLGEIKEEEKEEDEEEENEEKKEKKEESDDDSDFESEDEDKQGFIDDSNIDYHAYKYTISNKNSYRRTSYETKDLTIRKIQYVTGEILNDLGIRKLELFSGLMTLIIAFVVLWLRMAFHYLGQYLTLKIMNAPVMEVQLHWYKIEITYAFWNIGQQVAVISIGTITNTLVFLSLILICYLSQRYIFCFPRSFCKFIAWFGLATVFDFFLISVIDFAIQDWNGDLFKLYQYYTKASGSGFVGYFLTFVIHLGLLIVNLFIFYNYIVFIHNDGRLSDIYNRINGKMTDFFIPYDNEISFNYLRHLYQIAEINNNRIIVNKSHILNSMKLNSMQMTKLIHLYKFESEISLETGRCFFINQTGQIMEINVDQIDSKRPDTGNVDYYLKEVHRFIDQDIKANQVQRYNSGNIKHRKTQELLVEKQHTFKRRLTIQSGENSYYRNSMGNHVNNNNDTIFRQSITSTNKNNPNTLVFQKQQIIDSPPSVKNFPMNSLIESKKQLNYDQVSNGVRRKSILSNKSSKSKEGYLQVNPDQVFSGRSEESSSSDDNQSSKKKNKFFGSEKRKGTPKKTFHKMGFE